MSEIDNNGFFEQIGHDQSGVSGYSGNSGWSGISGYLPCQHHFVITQGDLIRCKKCGEIGSRAMYSQVKYNSERGYLSTNLLKEIPTRQNCDWHGETAYSNEQHSRMNKIKRGKREDMDNFYNLGICQRCGFSRSICSDGPRLVIKGVMRFCPRCGFAQRPSKQKSINIRKTHWIEHLATAFIILITIAMIIVGFCWLTDSLISR